MTLVVFQQSVQEDWGTGNNDIGRCGATDTGTAIGGPVSLPPYLLLALAGMGTYVSPSTYQLPAAAQPTYLNT